MAGERLETAEQSGEVIERLLNSRRFMHSCNPRHFGCPRLL